MARRKIIRINESLCNGCSLCINACSEGALKLIDGKARLVREDFCDGFGDCLGGCPTGALTIEERESADFDLKATMDHVKNTRGSDGLNQFLAAAQEHGLLHQSANHPAHDSHGAPAVRPGAHAITGSTAVPTVQVFTAITVVTTVTAAPAVTAIGVVPAAMVGVAPDPARYYSKQNRNQYFRALQPDFPEKFSNRIWLNGRFNSIWLILPLPASPGRNSSS